VVRDVERELHSLLSNEIRTVQRRSAGLVAVSAILAAAEQSERREILANLAQRQPQFAASIDPTLWTEGAASRAPNSATHVSGSATHASGVRPHALGTTPPSFSTATHSPGQSSPRRGARDGDSDTSSSSARPLAPNRFDQRSSREERIGGIAFADLVKLDQRDWNELLKAVDPQSLLLALSGAPSELLQQLSGQLSPRERKELNRKITALGPIRLRDVDRAQQRVAETAAELMSRGKIRLAGEGRTLAAA